MDGTTVVALISVFGFAAFLVYMFFSTRHRERMALIESGSDAGIFSGLPKGLASLKWGLVLTMVGIGLAIGLYIDIGRDHDGPVATFPMVFIFAGLGFLAFYFLTKDKE
jgi:hypothetical protein